MLWHLTLPLVVCACGDESSTVMAIVGIAVFAYVMNQQKDSRPSPPVPFGPSPLPVSARLAETGERTSEEETKAVPNPRKAQTDLVEEKRTDDAEHRNVPQTHIVGFRWQPTSESRSRLMDRQRQEFFRHRLHQYE